MIKAVSWLMALVVGVAFYIFWRSDHPVVPPVCGVALPYEPFAGRVFKVADKGGNLIRRITTEPAPDVATIQRYVDGTMDVLHWMWLSLTDPLKAITGAGSQQVNPYAVAQPCTPPDTSCVPPQTPPAPDPANNKGVIIPAAAGGTNNTGAWSRDELVKMTIREGKRRGIPEQGWVSVVTAGIFETRLRNLPYGDRDSVGWLQQRAGWGSFKQRMDPIYATNKFYDALLKVPNWQSRSIASATQAVQVSASGAYAQFEGEARSLVRKNLSTAAIGPADPTPPKVDPPQPDTAPLPECTPTAGAGTIGSGSVGSMSVMTWNVNANNTTGQINSGIPSSAALVGLQEIRHNGALRVPGFGVTKGSMAVPMLWNTSKLDMVEWHRETAFDAGNRVEYSSSDNQSRTKQKSVVWGVWTDKATGKSFGAINTHMLVGSAGNPRRQALWNQQAAKVNSIRAKLQARGLPVILLGDMNAPAGKVGPTFGGMSSFSALGTMNTHGGGTLDYVISYGARPSSQQTLAPFGSDHRRVIVTFSGPSGVGKRPPTSNPGPVPLEFNRLGNPRTVAEALAWMRTAAANDGMNGERVVGRCERYMNLAYGLGGGYATARGHWLAAGPKHAGSSTPPAGALVFWDTSNSAGHVALSMGGGLVASTDYSATAHRFKSGSIDIGPIQDIDRWGARLGWRAPNFNTGRSA